MKAWHIHLSLASILMSGIVFVASPAWAQADGAPAKDSKGEKIKTLNFEDELVEGDTQKPELFYLFQKKNFNYKRLIKLRENFLPEMRKTSEEVQRVRSQD
jgi:hypothetical protein